MKQLTSKEQDCTTLEKSLQETSQTLNKLVIENSELETMFNTLINSIASPILLVNNEKELTTWNQAAKNLFKIKSSSEKQQDILSLIHMGRNRIKEGFMQSIKENTNITISSVNVSEKTGTDKLIDISFVPLMNHKKEQSGSVIICRDITDIASANAEITRLQHKNKELMDKFQDAHKQLQLISQSKSISPSIIINQPISSEENSRRICGDKSIVEEIDKEISVSLKNKTVLSEIDNKLDITDNEPPIRTRILEKDEA